MRPQCKPQVRDERAGCAAASRDTAGRRIRARRRRARDSSLGKGACELGESGDVRGPPPLTHCARGRARCLAQPARGAGERRPVERSSARRAAPPGRQHAAFAQSTLLRTTGALGQLTSRRSEGIGPVLQQSRKSDDDPMARDPASAMRARPTASLTPGIDHDARLATHGQPLLARFSRSDDGVEVGRRTARRSPKRGAKPAREGQSAAVLPPPPPKTMTPAGPGTPDSASPPALARARRGPQ